MLCSAVKGYAESTRLLIRAAVVAVKAVLLVAASIIAIVLATGQVKTTFFACALEAVVLIAAVLRCGDFAFLSQR